MMLQIVNKNLFTLHKYPSTHIPIMVKNHRLKFLLSLLMIRQYLIQYILNKMKFADLYFKLNNMIYMKKNNNYY